MKMIKLVFVILMASCINNINAAKQNDQEKSIAIHDLLKENQEYGPVLPERFCSSPGVMCKNCTTTVLCIEFDEGIFEEHAADHCIKGQTCLETKCVESNMNPHCSDIINYPFRCGSVGMFPDQLDCRKFHLCVPITTNGELFLKNFDAECPTGYKYNAKTTYCDKKLVNNRCFANINEFPVPLCLKNGDLGVLQENPSIFYICEYYILEQIETTNDSTTTEGSTVGPEDPILYAFLYLCAHGKIFDPEELRCVDPPRL